MALLGVFLLMIQWYTMSMIDVRILRFKTFAAASGPGGQHVNKVASAVELRCYIKDLGLPEAVEARLRVVAGRRVSAEDELILVGKEFSSAARNKAEVIQRLIDLVLGASRVPARRKATKPTRASSKKRLEGKKIRSDLKKSRKVSDD